MNDIKDQSTTSGVDKATSGAEDLKVTETTSGESEGLAKTLEKALREKKNAMEKIRDMEAQLKKATEEKLSQSENWKQLAEMREQELSEINAKLKEKEAKITDASINGALRNELLKFGMNTQLVDYALRLVDKKGIQIDSDTGVVIGAADVVREFHKTFAGQSFFTTPKATASHGAPNMDQSLSGDDAFKAELRNAKTQKELELVMRKHGKLM